MGSMKLVFMPVATNLVFRRTSRPSLSLLVVQNYSHNVSQEVVPDVSKTAEPASVKKKQQKSPFVKNLFLGEFDHDVLTYPEVLDKERLQTLSELVAPIERFFSEGNSFYTFYIMITLSLCHDTTTTTTTFTTSTSTTSSNSIIGGKSS